MPKFCPTCGNSLQYENAEICPKCGVRISIPSTTSENFGGFWVRLAAYIVDSVIIAIVIYGLLFGLIFFAAIMGGSSTSSSSAVFGIIYLLWLLFAIIFSVGYYAYQESSEKRATIGKQLMGIVITDYNGMTISFGTAVARYLAKIVSALALCIGFIMIGFTEKKQGLHDYIAKTYVIKKTEPNTIVVFLVIGIFALGILVIIAAVIAAFVFGMAGNISKTKVVAVTAYQQGDDIVITYQGGQDASSLTDIVCNTDASESVWKSPNIGERFTIKGGTNYKDHIVCSADFIDGSNQVILDTYV